MQKKLAITLIMIMLALIWLIAVIYLIIKNNNEEYSKKVLSQRQSSYDSRTIPFRRGDILDRNGTILASSQKIYNLILDPKVILQREDYIDASINALVEYFGYDENELRSAIMKKKNKSYLKYEKELSYDDKDGFIKYMEEKNKEYISLGSRERIRGIWFEDEYKRYYPYNSMACNIIGFSNHDGNQGTGGVEQYYNDKLIGLNGREYGYLDSDTKLQSVIREASNGNTIKTTINTNIQLACEKYIKKWQNEDVGSKEAAIIVMDPNTFEVLAMADSRTYDLNNPRKLDERLYPEKLIMELGKKEAADTYKREHPELAEIDPSEASKYYSMDQIESYGKQVAWNQMWRNFTVSDTYEPGSTAKPFTVAGALEEGAVGFNSHYNCKGYIELSDGVHSWRIRCHNRNGHGDIDLKHGIMHSCNMAMLEVAFAEGAENFVKYQDIFGFGGKTGIDLPAEADTSKFVFDAEELGKTALATNSFGQNFNVTMIQMASAYCSIINGGSYYRPHVLKQILNYEGTVIKDVKPELLRTTVSKPTCDFLKDALFHTVEEGTGKLAKIKGYHVGGKTGTAEKLPRYKHNYLVSFCGFAPVEDPRLLVYVVVDQPNLEGQAQATASFATRIFKEIMNDSLQYLNVPASGETDPEDSINKNLELKEGINTLESSDKNEKDDESNEIDESENVETLGDLEDLMESSSSEIDENTDETSEIDDEYPDVFSKKIEKN